MTRKPTIMTGLVAASVLALPVTGAAGEPSSKAMTDRGESFQERSQTTIGGSEYFVQGKITNIDKDKKYYWVKQPSGSEVRLEITKATHMFCPTRSDEKRTKTANIDMSQKAGTGFRIGDCPFREGDYIKAETTDVGTATFIRAAFKGVPEDQVPVPRNLAEEAGMPADYLWLPVPLGSLDVAGTPLQSVQNWDGEKLGTLERVILDRRGGRIEYGVVTLAESGRLMPIPWEAFEVVDGKDVDRVVRVKLRKEQMIDIPTFSLDTISMAKVLRFWKGEVSPGEKPMLTSFGAPWMMKLVDDYHKLSAFDQAFKDAPHMPRNVFRILNDAAEDLEEGKRHEATEHFRKALRRLDEGVEQHAVSKTAAEKLKALVVMHAPQRFIEAIEPGDRKPSIKMREAIAIATGMYPGEVINATYLGEYGKKAYRVAIMAGTGVTRSLVIDAESGQVRENVVEPGHPMPNEPFR